MTNHLKNQSSRYLQQHVDNPVDWYPWCDEAINKARKENKPILLSIGYSACHWCHVMAQESFADDETAKLMNDNFINIKLDREERPDLDKIYQMAHQLLTGKSGGWPLTLFLTPLDLTPFFAGTYFPKSTKYNLPAFKEVLTKIAGFYRDQLQDIENQNNRLQYAFAKIGNAQTPDNIVLDNQPLLQARNELDAEFDAVNGGFGNAPKFPQPTILERLLYDYNNNKNAPSILQYTLMNMACGGIYDQLGGGFFRYSVDAHWEIPHFEKMLYDNAQLLSVYAQAFAITPNHLFEKTIHETCDWLLREMQAPEGGFYATLDADSEHEEGKFYCWDKAEMKQLLTKAQYKFAEQVFGLNQSPNFEQHWHLNVPMDLDPITDNNILNTIKSKLFSARELRIHPGRDEKIITSWNALLIKGLALAGLHLNDKKLIKTAQQTLDFMRDKLWINNHLYAHYQNNAKNEIATSREQHALLAMTAHNTQQKHSAKQLGFLDDYAFLLDAILTLLQIEWRQHDFDFAIQLADQLLALFEDEKNGGFFFTAKDTTEILYRPKPMLDEALPAGNGVAALALQRLSYLTGENRYLLAAEKTLRFAWGSLTHYASVHNTLLTALEEYLIPPQIIILRGAKKLLQKWIAILHQHFVPQRLIFAIPNTVKQLPGSLAQQTALPGKVVAYICQGHQCLMPIDNIDAFKKYLNIT